MLQKSIAQQNRLRIGVRSDENCNYVSRHYERLAYHKGILPRTARLLAYDVSK